ncbi:hypothetical protein LOAG_16310, partial [Loa loa]
LEQQQQQQHQERQQQQQQRYRRSAYYHQNHHSYLQEDYHPEYPIKSTFNLPDQYNFIDTINVQHIESSQSIPVQMSTISKLQSTSNIPTNTILPLLPIGFHCK